MLSVLLQYGMSNKRKLSFVNNMLAVYGGIVSLLQGQQKDGTGVNSRGSEVKPYGYIVSYHNSFSSPFSLNNVTTSINLLNLTVWYHCTIYLPNDYPLYLRTSYLIWQLNAEIISKLAFEKQNMVQRTCMD